MNIALLLRLKILIFLPIFGLKILLGIFWIHWRINVSVFECIWCLDGVYVQMVLYKVLMGRLHPEVQPLTFEHSILIEKVPFGIQILLLFGQFWPTTTAYSRIPTAEPSIAAHRKGKHSLSIYAVKKRKNQVKRKKAKISAKENKFPVSKGRFVVVVVVVFIFFYFLSIYKT